MASEYNPNDVNAEIYRDSTPNLKAEIYETKDSAQDYLKSAFEVEKDIRDKSLDDLLLSRNFTIVKNPKKEETLEESAQHDYLDFSRIVENGGDFSTSPYAKINGQFENGNIILVTYRNTPDSEIKSVYVKLPEDEGHSFFSGSKKDIDWSGQGMMNSPLMRS
jgi:hypothetical protein